MNGNNPRARWGGLLLSLVYTVFIISFSVIFTVNFRQLYYLDIKHLNIAELSGLTENEIRQNYDAVVDYNSFFNRDPLSFPTLRMSDSGRIHFEDVKNIFDMVGILFIATLILGILGTLYQHKEKDYGFLRTTSIMTVALPAMVGILLAINWDASFVIFHKVFFRNDYWVFDPATDPVITILPQTFFLHCAMLILAGILMGSAICHVTYRMITK